MGTQLYLGTDLRIANEVTFMPSTDPLKHHVIVTAICNRGKSAAGKELRDEISLNFWGKRAVNAAHYLYKGKQINVIGRLQSYTEDKGETNAAGKRILNRKIEVVVTRMELLGDSMREMTKIVADNIQLMVNNGEVPAALLGVLTAERLLKSNKPKPVEFNPTIAAQTGYFGRAKVWTKDRGFWTGGNAPAPAAVPNADTASMAAEIERLQSQLANAEGQKTAEAGADADPFPVS
jgi:single-stranded DNA-binding protein